MQKVGRPTARPHFILQLVGVMTAIAILLPLVYLLIRAAGAGVEELWTLITRPRTLEITLNSIGLAITVTLLSALIAIPLAFLTVRTDLPGRRFWLIVTTLPLAIPTYVGSFALIAAFGPRGSILQLLLQPLGVERLPSIYGWFGATVAITLFTYPYLLISVRSALQGMDPALEEASRSLGHSSHSTFFRVTLPHLRPAIAAGGLLVALYTLQDFGTPALMRFDSFTRAIFLQYRSSFNRNLAAALALMLVLLVLAILALEYRARTKAKYYSRGSGSRQQQRRIPLGKWKGLALAFCIFITLISLVLPVGVIGFWLYRGMVSGGAGLAPFQGTLTFAFNSIYAAGLAALVSTLFALPIAILAVRFPSRFSTSLEVCSYLGFGMPGIVVALSLVYFGANYLPALYQKLPILIFAYLILFLPQSVGMVRNSLLQVSPTLEESARCLGRTSWQTIRDIVIPLVRPGIISGAMLIFLTAIKELPATLLLAPIGFRTLAIQVWLATAEDAAFSQAAAAALVILAVCTVSTLVILSQEYRQGEKNGVKSRG
ncbi:iron ABC transporter permease [filamentous cyanobacterium CCP2]|nr:iron ABC transporter permease [filamentous cyanobacterium CCP2]